jgi:N-formylmaleamate deformylase
MTEWQEGDVEVSGLCIHYYRTGGVELPPLVLCHGFSDNGLCWYRVAKVLEEHFDVVMIDARNHGQSDRGPADLALMADDVAGVIKFLKLEKPILMGHSMGASMVAEVAARYPDLAPRLVLEDPPWTKYQGPAREGSAEKRREGFKQHLDSLMQMSHEDIVQFGKNTNAGWHQDDLPAWAQSKKQVSETAMDGLMLGSWSEPVAKIQCSALLVYADGEGDGIVTHEIASEVLAANKNFTAQHIPGAGHNTRREQFDAYIKAVSAFLDN